MNSNDNDGKESNFEAFLRQWTAMNGVRGGRFFGRRK